MSACGTGARAYHGLMADLDAADELLLALAPVPAARRRFARAQAARIAAEREEAAAGRALAAALTAEHARTHPARATEPA